MEERIQMYRFAIRLPCPYLTTLISYTATPSLSVWNPRYKRTCCPMCLYVVSNTLFIIIWYPPRGRGGIALERGSEELKWIILFLYQVCNLKALNPIARNSPIGGHGWGMRWVASPSDVTHSHLHPPGQGLEALLQSHKTPDMHCCPPAAWLSQRKRDSSGLCPPSPCLHRDCMWLLPTHCTGPAWTGAKQTHLSAVRLIGCKPHGGWHP